MSEKSFNVQKERNNTKVNKHIYNPDIKTNYFILNDCNKNEFSFLAEVNPLGCRLDSDL